MRTKLLALCSLLACLAWPARASECVLVQVDASAARARIAATANAAACIEIVRTPRVRKPAPDLRVLVFGDPQPQSTTDSGTTAATSSKRWWAATVRPGVSLATSRRRDALFPLVSKRRPARIRAV